MLQVCLRVRGFISKQKAFANQHPANCADILAPAWVSAENIRLIYLRGDEETYFRRGRTSSASGVIHNFFAINVKFGSVTVSEITLSFSIKKLMTTDGEPL